MTPWLRVACCLPLLGGALGCASKQTIALDCVPREVVVFVDGRQLRPGTKTVELATDEPHTFFFKGGVYEPQLVVLESVERNGDRALSPNDVCSHTAFMPVRPDVRMEVDTGVSEGPPGR